MYYVFSAAYDEPRVYASHKAREEQAKAAKEDSKSAFVSAREQLVSRCNFNRIHPLLTEPVRYAVINACMYA